MKAYELISDKSRFCRNFHAIGESKVIWVNPVARLNKETGEMECKAKAFDLCGALQHVYTYAVARGYLDEIDKRVVKIKDGKGNILYHNWAEFNDAVPHEEVVNMLRSVEEKN